MSLGFCCCSGVSTSIITLIADAFGYGWEAFSVNSDNSNVDGHFYTTVTTTLQQLTADFPSGVIVNGSMTIDRFNGTIIAHSVDHHTAGDGFLGGNDSTSQAFAFPATTTGATSAVWSAAGSTYQSITLSTSFTVTDLKNQSASMLASYNISGGSPFFSGHAYQTQYVNQTPTGISNAGLGFGWEQYPVAMWVTDPNSSATGGHELTEAWGAPGPGGPVMFDRDIPASAAPALQLTDEGAVWPPYITNVPGFELAISSYSQGTIGFEWVAGEGLYMPVASGSSGCVSDVYNAAATAAGNSNSCSSVPASGNTVIIHPPPLTQSFTVQSMECDRFFYAPPYHPQATGNGCPCSNP